MKYITDYEELGGKKGRNLKDFVSEVPPQNKSLILQYLRNGRNEATRCSLIYDYIKKEQRTESIFLYTDGEYVWDSEEVYHYKMYNLKLNPEFEKKVEQLHD